MLWGLGSSLGAGSEGGLGTPLPVEHLEEELNTKLLGQLCWNSPPAPRPHSCAEWTCLDDWGRVLLRQHWGHSQAERVAWCGNFRLWGPKGLCKRSGETVKIQPRLPQEIPDPSATCSQLPWSGGSPGPQPCILPFAQPRPSLLPRSSSVFFFVRLGSRFALFPHVLTLTRLSSSPG